MRDDQIIEALAGKRVKGQIFRTGQRVRLLKDRVIYKKGDTVTVLYSYTQRYPWGDRAQANIYSVTGKYGSLSWLDAKDLSALKGREK